MQDDQDADEDMLRMLQDADVSNVSEGIRRHPKAQRW